MMGFLRPAISCRRAAALCTIALALAQAPAFAQLRQGLAPADSSPSFAPLPPATPQVPDQQQLAPPQQAPSAGQQQQSGVFEQWGRWWDQSITSMNQSITNMNNSWKDTFKSNVTPSWPDTSKATSEAAADMAKGAAAAADAMGKLGTSRVIAGPVVCPLAPNGAPDCRAAADAACRGKGFASGRSLDTQSAQKCPARVWLSGRLPAEGDCTLETFLTRAVCQ